MRIIIFMTGILLFVAVGMATAADSSGDRQHSVAYSLTLSGGPGWGRITDNGLRFYDDYALIPQLYDREAGAALELGADVRLTPATALGIIVSTWSRTADTSLANAHFDLMLIAATATWYPWRGGLHVVLGYGLGIARLEYLERGIADTRIDTGTGYRLGLGYDIRLTDTIALTPRITNSGFATRDLEVWASLTTAVLAVTIDLWE